MIVYVKEITYRAIGVAEKECDKAIAIVEDYLQNGHHPKVTSDNAGCDLYTCDSDEWHFES